MVLYSVLLFCIFLMCCACIAWPIGYIGVAGHCLGFCAHLAIIIFTGIARYNTNGEICAGYDYELWYNESADSFTYKDHGSVIQGLFISACVLLCLFNCCILFMMAATRGLKLLS